MKTIRFVPSGVCAREMRVTLTDDDVIEHIEIDGGCDGNHKGLIALCEGQPARKVAERLEGITCSFRRTSCPDQLAKAIRKLE